MEPKKSRAINYFNNGYNCAQAVALTFDDILEIDRKYLEQIACGFGGGMGRLQKTCGAVTGAFMVISLFAAQISKNNESCKEISKTMIRDFHRSFISLYGTSDCRDLLGCDLNTEEGQAYKKEHGLSESVCNECIGHSVNIIERLMDRNERYS